jgi:hypothetical protein
MEPAGGGGDDDGGRSCRQERTFGLDSDLNPLLARKDEATTTSAWATPGIC